MTTVRELIEELQELHPDSVLAFTSHKENDDIESYDLQGSSDEDAVDVFITTNPKTNTLIIVYKT